MADWKMYPDEVSKLIDLYSQNECLWNCQNEQYKRTDLKRNAWDQLSRHFGKSIDDIKRKIKYLRSAYLHEKKRADDSRRNARPGTSVYRPRLFYYTDFNFLDPVIILRKTATPNPEPEDSYIEQVDERDDQEVSPNPENEMSDENENFILIEEANAQPRSPAATFQSTGTAKVSTSSRTERTPKRRRSATAIRFEEVVDPFDCNSSKTGTEESIYSAFGKTISLQLSLLSPLEATSTMAMIHQLLSKKIMRSMIAAQKRRYSSSEESDKLNDGSYSQYNTKRVKNHKYED